MKARPSDLKLFLIGFSRGLMYVCSSHSQVSSTTPPSSNLCFLKLALPGSAHRLKAFAIGFQSSRLIPQPLSYTRPGSPSDNEGLTLLHASRSALVVGWCFLAPAQHVSTHGGKAVTLRKLEDHCLRCCVPGLVPQGTANSFSTSCVHACGSEFA